MIFRLREIDLKEQKKSRRKLREEKRKAKILEKLEIAGSDEINEKIAKEEKKLLRVQRKLEAIRLVEELFRRIQDKNPYKIQLYDDIPNPSRSELKHFKNSSELELLTQREKLHNALKGRVMLKTILADSSRTRRYSSSSSDSNISIDMPIHPTGERPRSPVFNKYPELLYERPNWLGYPSYVHTGPLFSESYHHFMGGYIPRGRGFPRIPNVPGPSRGGYNRRRGGYRYRGGGRGSNNYNQYPPEVEEEYQKYFNKFLNEHEDRRRKSYSPDRRRHRSLSRSYSNSPSRSRSRTRKRSRDRRSRSDSYRSRSRSKRRSYSRSRSKSRSRSRYRDRRSRSRSHSRSMSKKRSPEYSRSKRHTESKEKKCIAEKSKRDKKIKSKSRSREKSVDSSTFMTPSQLLESRARSKSWSLPKEGENKERSWSKSPKKD